MPSVYNEYYNSYGSTSGKEDAASAQLREYYGHQAHAHAAQAYAAYAAQDPALYPYAVAAAVHSGSHHHLPAASGSHGYAVNYIIKIFLQYEGISKISMKLFENESLTCFNS